jgi:hypothetical protein
MLELRYGRVRTFIASGLSFTLLFFLSVTLCHRPKAHTSNATKTSDANGDSANSVVACESVMHSIAQRVKSSSAVV